MDKLRVTVGYNMGHSHDSIYCRDREVYCPLCGSQSVWFEDDEGDYYSGPNHVCTACGGSFALPYAAIRKDVPYLKEAQIVAQIRSFFPLAFCEDSSWKFKT